MRDSRDRQGCNGLRARSWIKRLETKGLCLGAIDNFPEVDAHAQTQQLDFVYQRDVHAAIDIFKKLGRLGDGRGGHTYGATKDAAVEGCRQFSCHRAKTTNYLGDVVTLNVGTAGIFAFRRKRNIEMIGSGIRAGSARQASLITSFQDRDQNFFRGTRITNAFLHDELPRLHVRCNAFSRLDDVAHVGLAICIERRRHADNHDILIGDASIVRSGRKAPLTSPLDLGWLDPDNVGSTIRKRLHLRRIDVEGCDRKALATKKERQRQPDVTHADHTTLASRAAIFCIKAFSIATASTFGDINFLTKYYQKRCGLGASRPIYPGPASVYDSRRESFAIGRSPYTR